MHLLPKMELPMVSSYESLLQLCASLFDQDSSVLQIKISRYLKHVTQAETVFLLFVSEGADEFSCQVVGNEKLEEEITFPLDNDNLSSAIREKRAVSEKDFDKEKLQELGKRFQCNIRSLLCIPVSHPARDDQIVLLACLANKKDAASFSERDSMLVKECFCYSISILMNTLAFEEERRLKVQCQSLLTVAQNLFKHLDDVTVLLKEIMADARKLTKAERCSLFLLDRDHQELIAKVFDGNLAEDGTEQNVEVRIPVTQGIAGHVAMTGELLNIRDAYSHPLFYRGMDESTGFKTRNILCFPIKDDEGVIGIAELCNKINGLYFSTFDEEIATAFSIYCGISIMHSLMYQKVLDAQHRSKLSNELMMYHMKVLPEDVQKLAKAEIPLSTFFHEDFCKFSFTPRNLPESETPLMVKSMLEDLGMINRWRINRDTLARFILMVRKGYRDPPYHNWIHAFSVAHFCYISMKSEKMVENEYLMDVEALALFVACLCHDLDHRGTTNSFQVASKSILAALYSSEGSVMERHHFAQCMCILNTDGCNILESLSRKEYTQCLDVMRDAILATDLAHHLRIMKDLDIMIENGYDKNNKAHHKLLISLLMTACDLCDQTKDWHISKKIAELVYREFFSQGDLEKAMGNCPLEMMDREKACIPELQISFLTHIALPAYKLLAKLFPQMQVAVDSAETNKLYWERMKEIYKKRHTTASSSLDIFDDEELDIELENSFNNSQQNPSSPT